MEFSTKSEIQNNIPCYCVIFLSKINVLIIGGSVTAGYDLPDRQLTWANQIKSKLSSICNVEVMSGSGQGSTYFMGYVDFWSRVTKEPRLDVIIAEFSINDQYFGSIQYGRVSTTVSYKTISL